MKVLLLFVLVLFIGCMKEPMQTNSTDNKLIKVELLFTIDGAKVYRFNDGGRFIYFVLNKSGARTEADYTVNNGKRISHYKDSVQTINQ